MSDLIKKSLKELSHELNLIQTKKKEISKKFDLDAKWRLLKEINVLNDNAKETV